ncbi:hypothetical protein CHS0354_010810 [Potamilus streckersoni]|uniref:Uncharacterized protein n=1 Tax=Potamilus streckersoni TaxID=2493646 RepID=A0AAE0TA94_9BIVA|nr:hypothetical protein CHS0354_010810 [Potamilus streckersoni]
MASIHRTGVSSSVWLYSYRMITGHLQYRQSRAEGALIDRRAEWFVIHFQPTAVTEETSES